MPNLRRRCLGVSQQSGNGGEFALRRPRRLPNPSSTFRQSSTHQITTHIIQSRPTHLLEPQAGVRIYRTNGANQLARSLQVPGINTAVHVKIPLHLGIAPVYRNTTGRLGVEPFLRGVARRLGILIRQTELVVLEKLVLS